MTSYKTWLRLLLIATMTGMMLALLGCAFVVHPSEPEEMQPDDLNEPVLVQIAASWAALPLAEDLVATYGGLRSGLTIEIVAVDAETARKLATSGQVDLAIMAAPDAARMRQLAPTLPFELLAHDALAIVAHRDSSLTQLSLAELESLYAGDYANWSALDAGEGTSVFAVQGEATVAREVFDREVMRERSMSTAALVLPNDEAVLRYVAEHPLAIGYLSAAYVARDDRVKWIALDGVLPEDNTLAAAYPLRYELFITLGAEPSLEAARLQTFALGRQGRELIAQRYALPD